MQAPKENGAGARLRIGRIPGKRPNASRYDPLSEQTRQAILTTTDG
jgi:hypothetical protein